jgi:hypothetical protein
MRFDGATDVISTFAAGQDEIASDATDRQIDALGYQLYGLAEDEIKIVEG